MVREATFEFVLSYRRDLELQSSHLAYLQVTGGQAAAREPASRSESRTLT